MERLTGRDDDGRVFVHGLPECYVPRIVNKLLQAVTERCATYEEAEEAGLLFRPPCKVGDMVYTINADPFHCDTCPYGAEAKYDHKYGRVKCDFPDGRHCPYVIREHECKGFWVRKDGAIIPGERDCGLLDIFYSDKGFSLYYSREEAEAALAARKEQDDESNSFQH
ncbi:MAG: hypothetical protein DBY27_03090 [Clostridiaceae bacterium]|nr:MAG: hypothetical protein DBY27_03090 [Clostridiaceae bacterium]